MTNWDHAAEQQRDIVDMQLLQMHAGAAPEHFAVVGRLLQRLRQESGLQEATLLDAGCSSAYYREIVEFYVPGWIEYVGVDASMPMLDMSRESYPGIWVLKRDLTNLRGMRDQSFDIVLSGATVCHVPDWVRAVRELCRVCQGYLILHRTWVYTDGRRTNTTKEDAYGRDVIQHRLNEAVLLALVYGLGLTLLDSSPSGEGEGRDWEIKTYLWGRYAN